MGLIYCIFLITFLIIQNESSNVRIIGGEDAFISRYNFMAAITVQTPTSRFFCGGVLYNKQFIITAGQCVDGATLFTIRLGSVHLNGDDPNRITLATSEYILHPDYNPLTFASDIGIIKLRMPVTHSDYINSLTPLAMADLIAKPRLRAVGWGQTSDFNSSLSDHLKVVHLSSITNQECKLTYGDQIVDTMVCVVGNYNEGACHGDTGTPLLDYYNKDLNMHVGIASFVSGRGCEGPEPSGYTRTYPFNNWIRNMTRI